MTNSFLANLYYDIAITASPVLIATVLGSALIFINIRLGEKGLDAGLGFASGVMIYVSFVNLLIPSLEIAPISSVLLGFTIGIIIIRILDLSIPHIGIVKGVNEGARDINKVVLIALAIAIHNIPEGLAVGTSTMYNVENGLITSLAIAIQDIPEGLAVAIAVTKFGNSSRKGFLIGSITGLSEYLSAFIPLITLLNQFILLPIMFSLSSSMMIYIVIHEMVPEIFGHEHDEYATIGFLIGLLIAVALGFGV